MEKMLVDMTVNEFTAEMLDYCVGPGFLVLTILAIFYTLYLMYAEAMTKKSFGKGTKITKAQGLELLSNRPETIHPEIWSDYVAMAMWSWSTNGVFYLNGALYKVKKH